MTIQALQGIKNSPIVSAGKDKVTSILKKPMVFDWQGNLIVNKTTKDVFGLTLAKGDKKAGAKILEKAEGALLHKDEIIGKAGEKGIKNLAERFGIEASKDTLAKDVLKQIESKSENATDIIAKKLKIAKVANIAAAAVLAVGLTAGIVKAVKSHKAKKEAQKLDEVA